MERPSGASGSQTCASSASSPLAKGAALAHDARKAVATTMPNAHQTIELLVATYPTRELAEQALDALLDRRLLGQLVAEAAVVRQVGSSRRVEAEVGPGLRSGGILDTLFPSRMLSGDAVGVGADDAKGHFEEFGLPVNVLRELGENIPPGGAALLLAFIHELDEDLQAVLTRCLDVARFGLDAAGSERLLNEASD